ncbi:hypothetical protein [Paeniglutamicibacter cryotolerans]|uniref:Glycine zipper domain-containing protein n=1 Tax=Paeniglutamicibacter cryotolerans TaxID=670079 RepID=A0A839QG22_9MICC|nr:hypothetical protein [Paeniglutamicibacter cryotolerans]MBB2994627.1 hypothetical protein [Paeniglutamicibacter cryotolerans]
MSVDLSGLPELPDTGALREDALTLKEAAAALKALCGDCQTGWRPIQGTISCSNDQEAIYTALDRMDDYGEALDLSATVVASALATYCDEIDGLRNRYNAAVSASMVCYAPDATVDGAQDPTQKAQDEVNAVAALMLGMEQRCADSIKAADPGSSTPAPDYSRQDMALAVGAQEALKRLRTADFQFTVSITISIRTLDYSKLEIPYADGSLLTHERLVLTQSSIRTDVAVRGTAPVFSSSPRATIGEPPRWAKIGGNVLGVLDVGLTAWGAGSDEWNDDLIDHPEYSERKQWDSAIKSAGLRTAGAAAGGAAGTAVGAAAGAAIFGTLGSVVPVAGTAAGIAVGGFLGGVVGGFVGSTVGEGIGGFLDNISDGEGLGDAIGNAWNDLWG